MNKFRRKKLRMRCVDMGGARRFRPLWERHCEDAHVIVWVVDSADVDGAVEAKDALRETLGSTGLAGIPLLVLGNKSDLTGARGIPELVDALGLKDIVGREASKAHLVAKAFSLGPPHTPWWLLLSPCATTPIG